MNYNEFVRRTVTVVSIVAVVLLLWSGVQNFAFILLIQFTCWVLALALGLPMRALQGWGLKRRQAIVITIVGTLALLGIIVLIIVPPLVTQTSSLVTGLPGAIVGSIEQYTLFRENYAVAENLLPPFTVEDYNALFETNLEQLDLSSDDIAAINLSQFVDTALPLLGGFGSFVGSLLANLALIVFITLYLLLDPNIYYRMIIALVPKSREERTLEIINEVRQTIMLWLGALSISVSVTAVMVFFMTWLLGVPNPVALAVISGLGNIIPTIGYYAAVIPVIIFAAAQGPTTAILAGVGYYIIGEIEGKFITPSVMKAELSIPAGAILLFQLVAASLLGFFGLLLAVPLLAVGIALVRELYVYDSLDKRGEIPQVVEGWNGDLVLDRSNLRPEKESLISRPRPEESPTGTESST